MIVTPSQGGCWFCWNRKNYHPYYISREFDTNYHIECLKEALAYKGNDLIKAHLRDEAQIILENEWNGVLP